MVLYETQKSMTTLLKIALPLTRKIQNNLKTIEHLVQQAGDLVTTLVPPEPPPRPPVTTSDSTVTTSKPTRSDDTSVTPSTSVALPPPSPS